MIVLGLLAIVLLAWATYEVRLRYFPAPVLWTVEDEEAATHVADVLGVPIETARLAVLAWR